ncbi:MAG: hypothetical protein QOF76_1386 [Solirubrobacteraceae bacterium]|jgi:signal transduction histidine kinase|nr:hypothetical protein [Solirubrobacteraceae bacterium]
MEIEHIEEWVGREVVDSEGESIGKLEQVYFQASDAVLAEIKPGMLSRKRLLVPLAGATVTRDFVRVAFTSERIIEESNSGAGYDHEDLEAVAAHYGAAHTYESDDLESGSARTERIAALEEARLRAEELEAAAARAGDDADAAAERARLAQQEADRAAEEHRTAMAEAERARALTL